MALSAEGVCVRVSMFVPELTLSRYVPESSVWQGTCGCTRIITGGHVADSSIEAVVEGVVPREGAVCGAKPLSTSGVVRGCRGELCGVMYLNAHSI